MYFAEDSAMLVRYYNKFGLKVNDICIRYIRFDMYICYRFMYYMYVFVIIGVICFSILFCLGAGG